MRHPLQGIALILLGILLTLLDVVGRLWINGWCLFGLILGIAGVIVAFLPNRHE